MFFDTPLPPSCSDESQTLTFVTIKRVSTFHSRAWWRKRPVPLSLMAMETIKIDMLTQMEDFQETLVMFSNASLSVIGSSRININISPNEVVIIRQSPAHCSSWDLQKTIEHLLVKDFAPQSTVIYSNIYLSTHLILPYLLYSISRSNLINLISDYQSILPIFLIYSIMINFQVQAADCWVFSTKKVRKVTIHNVLGYPNWLGCYLVSPAIQPPFQWVKAMSQVSQLWHTLG